MKLGIGSYTFAWAVGVPGHRVAEPMNAFDLLEQARSLGAAVVQYCDNLPLVALSDAERSELRRNAQSYGIELEVGTRGTEAENLQTHLELAYFLGSPFVRLVVDRGSDEPIPERAVERLRAVRDGFKSAGIKLGIENHDRFPARVLARMVNELGVDWVGIVLDTVNSLGVAEGIEHVVGTLAPATLNLHVKDFRVRRAPHQMGLSVEGVPAGEGMLDIPWLLDQVPPHINAILELWTPPQGSVEETIGLERRWVVQSMQYLRELLKERV